MAVNGLFDLQVNGYAGIDFNCETITSAKMDDALAAMARAGVSHCLPTLISADPDRLICKLRALDAAVEGAQLRAMVPGYHLEGPFLSEQDGYAGCHPPDAMRDPDSGLVERLEQGLSRPVLLITVAPERAGSEAFIGSMIDRGKVVALGHTAATGAQIAQAVQAGARLSTHLGNALRQMQPKFDNPLMAQLAEDRLWASVIADGIHVPPAAMKVMLRAKGLERSVLVTDATSAAGAPAGLYEFAGMTIERNEKGAVRAPGAAVLAGSSLTLDQAVRNVVAWGLATEEQAVRMARDNPRAVMQPALDAHGIVLG